MRKKKILVDSSAVGRTHRSGKVPLIFVTREVGTVGRGEPISMLKGGGREREGID